MKTTQLNYVYKTCFRQKTMKETILSIILRQVFCVDRDAHKIRGFVYLTQNSVLVKIHCNHGVHYIYHYYKQTTDLIG